LPLCGNDIKGCGHHVTVLIVRTKSIGDLIAPGLADGIGLVNPVVLTVGDGIGIAVGAANPVVLVVGDNIIHGVDAGIALTATMDPKTLVIFDVDDVLFDPVDAILQSQNEQKAQLFEQTIDAAYTQQDADDLYSIIWQQRALAHVDKANLAFLHYLQGQGIKTLALTNCIMGKFGRIPCVEDWRIAELQGLGYSFDRAWTHLKNKTFPSQETGLLKDFSFKSGVVFANTLPKGTVLEPFLTYAQWTPNKIILIDDLLDNLQCVHKLCQNIGIDFVGIHLTKVENRASEHSLLNMDIAKLQFHTLEKEKIWISDATAAARLSHASQGQSAHLF
jgi:hypothetical protein